MTQFEYLILEEEELNEKKINEYGKQGWELVSVIYHSIRGIVGLLHFYTYYFKRPYEKKEQCQEREKTQEENPSTKSNENADGDGEHKTKEITEKNKDEKSV